MKLTVLIGAEEVDIEVDKNNDTMNDLINKVIEKTKRNISVTLIQISGLPVYESDFSKKLSNWELDDGYVLSFSEYYDGGNNF